MDLKLTEQAREKILFFMQDKKLIDWGVRVVVKMRDEYSFSLVELSKAQATDQIIDIDGIKFIVDEISAKVIDGALIDFVESELSSGFKVELPPPSPIAAGANLDLENPIIQKINEILVKEINPGIAAHGGVARLMAYQNNIAYLQMGGGCQGCSQAAATVREGIERRLREAVPELIAVRDMTDHSSGENPYFS